MHKVRFKGLRSNGNWDGNTSPPVAWTPTWEFVGGFTQTTFPTGDVGRIPANLYGKAPAADPYILIATMWTNQTPATTDLVGVQTPSPQLYRDRWLAYPGNTHVSLVRPDDTITFVQTNTNGDAYLELLIEPLAATNEFGQVLLDYVREQNALRQLVQETETDLVVTGNTTLSSWVGTTRVRASAGAGVIITLPTPNTQRLRDLLIIEKDMVQPCQLNVPAGTFINGQASIVLTTNQNSVFIRGANGRYNLAGVL